MTDTTKNSAPIAPTSTAPAVKPENGTAVIKKNVAAGGATGSTAHRSNKKATGGAAYGITAKIPAYQPVEAGMVQGNGRLFAPAVNRTSPNFRDGINSQS